MRIKLRLKYIKIKKLFGNKGKHLWKQKKLYYLKKL